MSNSYLKEVVEMNLPNKLTLLRILLIPFFVIALLVPTGITWQNWIALAIFVIASLTDLADGKIARKYNPGMGRNRDYFARVYHQWTSPNCRRQRRRNSRKQMGQG